MMKKEYIQPSLKAMTIKAPAIMAGSEQIPAGPNGGSNKQTGAPTTVESKGAASFDYFDSCE